MPSILFVCTGNEYRSPIAAACFCKLLKTQSTEERWRIGSAGTWTIPNRPVPLEAVQNAILLGLDIEGHRTQVITHSLLEAYDLVLSMERGHKEALRVEFPAVRTHVYLLSEMAGDMPFDIPDPQFFPGQGYRILQDMCDLIHEGFPKIIHLAETFSRSRF